MASLKTFLEVHHEALLEEWTEEASRHAAAQGLSRPELQNILPVLLATVASGEESALPSLIGNHLAGRIRLGFNLAEIVHEFVILEQCFARYRTTLPPELAPDESAVREFGAFTQSAVVRMTELFHEHMERDEQLEKRFGRLLQTIAQEALHSAQAPLNARLQEVVSLIMEATDAHSASLILYEADSEKLMIAVSAGEAEAELEQFASGLSLSQLPGKIASRAEPTELTDVPTSELTVGSSLRKSGIQSLLGIRLPPQRRLLGILYVGLREERSFTPSEARRLEAMGERLTLHLDNARLFAELRTQIQELTAERALRERFVSILTHDLRGPLSTARLGSQILLDAPESLDQRRDIASRIASSLDRMDRMIRDLLDVSRVRAGEPLPLKLAECELNELAADVIDELASRYGARLELFAPERVRGFWSAEELRRALWNLVENALKYGAKDEPVTVVVERDSDWARVEVHNSGEPIPENEQEHLFDTFVRSKNVNPRAGWGLGLTLVRATAEAHGGTVHVRSDEAHGTTFSLELPLDSRERHSRHRPREGAPIPKSG